MKAEWVTKRFGEVAKTLLYKAEIVELKLDHEWT